MGRPKKPANVVGPQIQKFRIELGMTQEQFAVQCQLAGLDFSRGVLSQIEAKLRRITDQELLVMAQIFQVSTDDLYPPELMKRKR